MHICQENPVGSHEGVDIVSVLAHSPYLCLLGCFSQKLLESLADDVAACIENEVWQVGFFIEIRVFCFFDFYLIEYFFKVSHQLGCRKFPVSRVLTVESQSGWFTEYDCPVLNILDAIEYGGRIVLSDDYHRLFGFQKVKQIAIVEISAPHSRTDVIHFMGLWQLTACKLIEGFRYRNIDVYRSYLAVFAVDKGFVDQSLAMPCLFIVHAVDSFGICRQASFFAMNARSDNRQVHALVDHCSENIRLWKGLPILLPDPCARPVC